jgi:hypothetical protein
LSEAAFRQDPVLATTTSSEIFTITPLQFQPFSPSEENLLLLPISIMCNGISTKSVALLDSGATGCFIHDGFVRHHSIPTQPTKSPRNLTLADGRFSGIGPVVEETHVLTLHLGKHRETIKFSVTHMPQFQIIFGIPWLKRHNPSIDWPSRSILLRSQYCKENCGISKSVTIVGTATVPSSAHLGALTSTPEPGTNVLPLAYQDYSDVFDKAKADILPEHRLYDIPINLIENATLPRPKGIYHLSAPESKELDIYIRDMLSKGFIRPSQSNIAAGIFFVSKPGGGLRPCVDYRELNAITVKDRYPLPLTTHRLDQLGRATRFTKIDLRSAYNLVRVRPGDEWKTSFRCRLGQYEYLVMPFGLANAPSVFMRLIEDTLREFLDIFVVVYLDDILIYTSQHGDHQHHVRLVLERLRQSSLYAKLEKCVFNVEQVDFLGYVVGRYGVGLSSTKVDAVSSWPIPTNLNAVRKFLGLTNFYRRFVANYSAIAKPLTDLTKKDLTFTWTASQQFAFERLKSAITAEPILRHPNFDLPFILETDASDFALGAVLCQSSISAPKLIHPVAFWSRKLLPAELNYTVHDKGLLAIVAALANWRHYLVGSKFPIGIWCDHKNLTFFNTRKLLTPRHARWALTLSEFDFTIDHRRGITNTVADALSRRTDFEPSEGDSKRRLEQTLLPTSRFVTVNSPVLATLSESSPSSGPRSHQTAITDITRQLEIVRSRHDSPTAGHFGIRKTLDLVLREYWWPGVRTYVKKYVSTCEVCQRNKSGRHLPYGLLHPLPIPETPWSSVSLDFIVALPQSSGYDSILVVVDRLTKQAHFLPTTESSSTEDTANLYAREIFRLHGFPLNLVSDRGAQFKSVFWKALFNAVGATISLSSAYHPETDGQTERVNQTLEQYLRCFINYDQDDWVTFLPFAEFAYNNATHDSTGKSPFFATYGYHPRSDLSATPIVNDMEVPSAITHLDRIKTTLTYLREHLQRAQDRFRLHADRSRINHPFIVGDNVWLLTKNLQTTRPTNKLDYRKIGPFPIIAKINDVAFRLKLPPTFKIHDVFHVSLLEPHISNTIPGRIPPPPPSFQVEGEKLWTISKLLDIRRVGRGWKYLVDYEGYGPSDRQWVLLSWLEDTCWNEFLEFHRRHPDKPKPNSVISAFAEDVEV